MGHPRGYFFDIERIPIFPGQAVNFEGKWTDIQN
jgi:hypothetical protein